MKEEERYEIRTNKKTQLILQAADICEAYIISENKKVWNWWKGGQGKNAK